MEYSSLAFIVDTFKMTYTELAKMLGVTRSTVTDWASGRRPIPKEKLQSMCDIFRLDKEYIVNGRLKVRKLNRCEEIEIIFYYRNMSGWQDKDENEELRNEYKIEKLIHNIRFCLMNDDEGEFLSDLTELLSKHQL